MNASKSAALSNFLPAPYLGEIPQDPTITPGRPSCIRGDPNCRGDCLEALGAGSVDGKVYSEQLRFQARHIPRCWPTYEDRSILGEHIDDYASIENRERSEMGCSHHILYEIEDVITYNRRSCDPSHMNSD